MTNPEKLPGLHERRVEAIARAEAEHEADRFAIFPHRRKQFVEAQMRAVRPHIKRFIAADPATALLAECAEMMGEMKSDLNGWGERYCGENYNSPKLNDLLSRLGGVS